jgi:ectoine hydroxylase-related dioxygenase (phytanoyl-CoA dioxygenase family)
MSQIDLSVISRRMDTNLALDGHSPATIDDNVRSARFTQEFLVDKAVDREAAAARERVFAELAALKLEPNVAELEADGVTVLRPHQVAGRDFIERLRDTILRISGERAGETVDVANGATHSGYQSVFGQAQWEPTLLTKDPVFEQALMNRPALALITYLLGESCILNHLSSVVKGPGDTYLPFHTDQNQTGSIAPYPSYAQVANATWILTDYNRENGATCFVRGSHKLCRHPTYAEATDLSRFTPLEAEAGSVVIWHGNTWHGAVPRTAPGVRISLIVYFQRWYHPPIENLAPQVTPEMMARNPPRFAILTGVTNPHTLNFYSATSKASRVSLFS